MCKNFICSGCNDKCVINMQWDDDDAFEISGNNCNDGIYYAKEERKNNKDIFTTLVRIKGADCNVVPVKSSKTIDKKLWIDCSKALSMLYVGAPVKIGDIVCHNLLNTGVDILCTRNIDKAINYDKE
ncbi:MAG: DUF1667 domain-containing protein [Clostridiaceae bacterium]